MPVFYDTCSLLQLQKKVFDTEEKFYVSIFTIKELEGIKTSLHKDAEVKYSARQMVKLLLENEDKFETVFYDSKLDKKIEKLNLPDTNDTKIALTAKFLIKDDVLFHTRDYACLLVARAIGLKTSWTETYDEEYCGFKTISMDETDLADFYSNERYSPSNLFSLLPNQYLIIIDKTTGKEIDKYRYSDGVYHDVGFKTFKSEMFGEIKPKYNDIYQAIAMDSLSKNKITMIRGAAGTGKSYISFGYMFSLLEKGKIDKIIVFCNTVATAGSAKLGYYPGSKDEKLLDSQIGNLLSSKIGDKMMVESLIADGQLVLLPMSDIRGYDSTGMKAAIYITEAQNLNIELMRLALQRVGEDSICILDGDSDAQVDSTIYAGSNNGMRRVSEVFRGDSIYGEVTLQNIYRSHIADLAQRL